jgi:dephospho-CoA kinase
LNKQKGQAMTKVVAIVGMAGSGKSEVSRIFENHGFIRVRFGDLTDSEMKKRNLEPCEASERYCREILRKEHGMAAYAILSQPLIDAALSTANVVADGLYSWEEYLSFKSFYGNNFYVVAVYASPKTRHARLASRTDRALTREEAVIRDRSEIDNLNKGGPIAMADFTLVNETSLRNLRQQTETLIIRLNKI